jgi:uncharacterized protein YqgC (DUF456 family)
MRSTLTYLVLGVGFGALGLFAAPLVCAGVGEMLSGFAGERAAFNGFMFGIYAGPVVGFIAGLIAAKVLNDQQAQLD